MKPSTPLPHIAHGNSVALGWMSEHPGYADVFSDHPYEDAAYLVHAANLYPELVEALEQLCKAASDEWTDSWEWFDRARAVLAKCRVEP